MHNSGFFRGVQFLGLTVIDVGMYIYMYIY